MGRPEYRRKIPPPPRTRQPGREVPGLAGLWPGHQQQGVQDHPGGEAILGRENSAMGSFADSWGAVGEGGGGGGSPKYGPTVDGRSPAPPNKP